MLPLQSKLQTATASAARDWTAAAASSSHDVQPPAECQTYFPKLLPGAITGDPIVSAGNGPANAVDIDSMGAPNATDNIDIIDAPPPLPAQPAPYRPSTPAPAPAAYQLPDEPYSPSAPADTPSVYAPTPVVSGQPTIVASTPASSDDGGGASMAVIIGAAVAGAVALRELPGASGLLDMTTGEHEG